MKKLILIFLFIYSAAVAQGVRADSPMSIDPIGKPIPNEKVSLCRGPAAITTADCSPRTQSFADNLAVPIGSLSSGVSCVDNMNNRFYVGCNLYPATQNGLQAVFTAACAANSAGATVYLPPGNIALHNNAHQLLLVTCPLSIEGSGGTSSNLLVDAGISNTIPVIRYQPSSGTAAQFFRIKDVTISSAGAPTAGDALLLDGSNVNAQTPVFIDIGPHFYVNSGAVNGYAVNTANINASPAAGGLMWQLHDSILNGGVKMVSVADALSIRNNSINCSSSSTHADIELTASSGGAQNSIQNNWADPGCAGGAVILHRGAQVNIEDNQFQQGFSSTEANYAMIDLQGDVGALTNVLIRHNNLNAVNSGMNNATNNIRVDKATKTHIEDNIFINSSASGVGILFTPNPSMTRFPWNDFSGLSGGAVAYRNASNTTVFTIQGPGGQIANPTITSLDALGSGFSFASSVPSDILVSSGTGSAGSGVNTYLFNRKELRAGSSNLFSWSGAATAVSAAQDTGLSRVGANVIGVGNGRASDVSGEIRSALISATYNAAGTVQTAVHIVQDTCTLGTNCSVTLSGSAAFNNSNSYHCTCSDATSVNACRVNQTSGRAVTFTGTGRDAIHFICIGH